MPTGDQTHRPRATHTRAVPRSEAPRSRFAERTTWIAPSLMVLEAMGTLAGKTFWNTFAATTTPHELVPRLPPTRRRRRSAGRSVDRGTGQQREAGIAAAAERSLRVGDAVATPLATREAHTSPLCTGCWSRLVPGARAAWPGLGASRWPWLHAAAGIVSVVSAVRGLRGLGMRGRGAGCRALAAAEMELTVRLCLLVCSLIRRRFDPGRANSTVGRPVRSPRDDLYCTEKVKSMGI
ncbi:uncharacterized protein M421DRAFT_162565 [Didymella exigua CBS 183.55]|uniref:Uncharacterized protein n=1 Tax=Didymella exigua CBS 183.55 TaxID=1150837 RepID=A0A6A5RHS8_9PLEO|nr:uncharacterized protein M421DRAFT_162565 [Didymella exigua CBS 183.55]KAF1927881.1 hypothetical protein M421DRAFT_162565 [Didymella exigua CBS 183.55]